jgi:hypothetical protein
MAWMSDGMSSLFGYRQVRGSLLSRKIFQNDANARHLLLASFFFFSRTDPKRNNEKALIASVAYRIALNLPRAKDAIEAAVDRDPAIFQPSVRAQLTTLIIDRWMSRAAGSTTYPSCRFQRFIRLSEVFNL